MNDFSGNELINFTFVEFKVDEVSLPGLTNSKNEEV